MALSPNDPSSYWCTPLPTWYGKLPKKRWNQPLPHQLLLRLQEGSQCCQPAVSTCFMPITPKLGIWEYMFHKRPSRFLFILQFVEDSNQQVLYACMYIFSLVYVSPGISQISQTQSHLCCVNGYLQPGTGPLHFGNVGLDFSKDRGQNWATPYKGHPRKSFHGKHDIMMRYH